MNARWVAALLAVACVGLSVALVMQQKRSDSQLQAANSKADHLSAEVVRDELKLSEQMKVNSSLETNLAQRISEAAFFSNKLAFISAELAKLDADNRSAAEKAKEEIAARDQRIERLSQEKDAIATTLQELTAQIGSLQSKITETQRALASARGDRDALRQELQRLIQEKSALEKRFEDLTAVRAQLAKLREDAYLARRLELVRKGLIDMDRKGAQLLQKGIRPNHPSNSQEPIHSDLDAEIKAPEKKP
jgi:chromosome segregation ATPase